MAASWVMLVSSLLMLRCQYIRALATHDKGPVLLQSSAMAASSSEGAGFVKNEDGMGAVARIGGEYVCGGVPGEGCPDCPANPVCMCNGLVKIGNDNHWSEYVDSDGSIQCESASFGVEIFPHNPAKGKKCMCKPTYYQCASEYPVPTANCTSCTMPSSCTCVGEVRFGYGTTWTQWAPIHGTVECQTSVFGDPFIGQGKVCQCKPEIVTATEATATKPLISGFDSADRVTWAILIVILTHFMVYIPLAVTRVLHKTLLHEPGPIEQTLDSTAHVCISFAPMLCACFFAVTKRTETVTDYQADKHGLPQWWLSCAVVVAAVAFFFQTLFFVLSDATAYSGMTRRGTGENSSHIYVASGVLQLAKMWRVVSHVALGLMFAALAVVIVGILIMKEPADVFAQVGKTPISVATQVTLFLSVLYFGVHLPRVIFEQIDMSGGRRSPTYRVEVLRKCSEAVSFAPISSIAFMASQIAADWNGIILPNIDEVSMYSTAALVVVLVLLELAKPVMPSSELRRAGPSDEIESRIRDRSTNPCLELMSFAVKLAIFSFVVTVCTDVWRKRIVAEMTRMAFRLETVFFFAYALHSLATAAKHVLGADLLMGSDMLADRNDLCPMLAVLIVESWVRARHIKLVDGQVGEPQAYVQDLSYVATLSLAGQLLLVFVSVLLRQLKASHISKRRQQRLGIKMFEGSAEYAVVRDLGVVPLIWTLYYLALVVLYCSAVGIIYGLFTIGPKNANDSGAWIM